MDAVEVAPDRHGLQPALQSVGPPDVAVLDGGAEDRKPVAQRCDRDVEHKQGEPVSGIGEGDFGRMMPHRRRHIDVGIRVMQRMDAPEDRHRVLQTMDNTLQTIE
jgi:hypothetical protein